MTSERAGRDDSHNASSNVSRLMSPRCICLDESPLGRGGGVVVDEESPYSGVRRRLVGLHGLGRALLEQQPWDAIAAGETPRVAAKRLGLRRARIRELRETWANEGRLDYRRAPDLGWAVAS